MTSEKNTPPLSTGEENGGFSGLGSIKEEEVAGFFNLPVFNILKNSSAGILITDQNDQLVWINDVMLENPSLGSSVKSAANFILNKPATEALSYLKEFMLCPGSFTYQVKGFLAKREPRHGERFVLRNGGAIRLDYTPIHQNDAFQGAIWWIFNTPKESFSTLSSHIANFDFGKVLGHLQISVCEVSARGDILYASPSFCKLTGYRLSELLHVNLLNLCLSGKKYLTKYFKDGYPMLSDKTVSFELELTSKTRPRWVQCFFSNYIKKFSVHSGFLLLMTEITEQKNIQYELERAKLVAEQAQLAQQQFFANMSHDIRTPLNTIIGMSHLIEDTHLNNEQRDFIRIINSESNILMDLLNNVLDFSKIESGRQEVHPVEFNLREMLNSLLKTFSIKIRKEKDIHLNLNIDPDIKNLIIGDNLILNQILLNLFSNAVKFTKKGEITFAVRKQKESGRNMWIEFEVKDTGIGVPKEKLKAIFKDFVQGNEKIRNDYGGSGLGLFIVKRLVDLLGGDVQVKSKEGEGSTFTFSLPFVKTDKPAIIKEEKKVSLDSLRNLKARILVVEDNPMNLKYLKTILERLHLDFDCAEDGKTALEKGLSQYYDLILVDIRLPEMNGYEVTKNLRIDGNINSGTPIILVTAEALQETITTAKEVGANEVFLKPYTPSRFFALLDKYLNEEENEDKQPDFFQFNERLNGVYLNKLYSGNASYALSLFELFLDSLEDDWLEIRGHIENENWDQLIAKVHKIKPNFSMVGLTDVTQIVQLAYDKLKKGEYQPAVSLLRTIETDLPKYADIIKNERLRLQEYIGTHPVTDPDA